MSWLQQKKGRVDLDEFKDIDEDVLVETLSPEELADLNAAIDPEVGIWNGGFTLENDLCVSSEALSLSSEHCLHCHHSIELLGILVESFPANLNRL